MQVSFVVLKWAMQPPQLMYYNLHSQVIKKNYSLVFDKRVLKVNEGYNTYPYGCKKPV